MNGKGFPPPGAKVYSGEAISVSFEAQRCLHAAECVRGLPEVFDPQARPWIRLEGGDAERIAEVIERCPSGALQFDSAGAAPAEPARTEIVPEADGRLRIRGSVVVHTAAGARDETRLVLCGCGRTGNAPYCDLAGRCAPAPD